MTANGLTAAREDVEERTLSDVGHADDADLQVVTRPAEHGLLFGDDLCDRIQVTVSLGLPGRELRLEISTAGSRAVLSR